MKTQRKRLDTAVVGNELSVWNMEICVHMSLLPFALQCSVWELTMYLPSSLFKSDYVLFSFLQSPLIVFRNGC